MSTRKPKSFSLDDAIIAWLDELPRRGQSEYVNRTLHEHMMRYKRAVAAITAQYSRPQIMAVLDLHNGHIFMEGFSPRSEIVANLEDGREEVQDKWMISNEDYEALLQMNEAMGRCFKTLIVEYWSAGRRAL